MPTFQMVALEGLPSPVALHDCDPLVPILAAVLRDWPMRRLDPGEGGSAVITLRRTDGRYERSSPWLSAPVVFSDPVDAVCDFIVDLIHAHAAARESWLCLHGAAVELRAGLMIFPSTYRAGKSLLSLALVSCGARLFSDDVLPVRADSRSGMALGILPRLRLPLPDTAGPALTAFIDQRPGPQNKRYRYVRLGPEALAPRGTEAPMTAIAILRRGTGDKPSLRPAKKSDVVRDMVLRNFARRNPAIAILDQIHALVEQAQCFTLTYDTLDQAAALLDEAFGVALRDGSYAGADRLSA